MDDVLDPRDPEFRAWPMLTYYYGIGFQDLMLMPRWMRELYMRELPKFVGRDRLRMVEAALMPHIEADARDKAMRHIREQAQLGPTRGVVIEKPKYDGTLRGIGIGVKREDGKSRGRVKAKVRPGTRMVPKSDVASDETGHPEVTDA